MGKVTEGWGDLIACKSNGQWQNQEDIPDILVPVTEPDNNLFIVYIRKN